MNAAQIIKDSEDRAHAYSTDARDRLAYEVGVLRAHVRNLCHELEYAVEEIGNIEKMLMGEQS